MIAPNRERHGLIEFADEALDGSRTQAHCDDLIVFVTQRWLAVAEIMGVGQQILAVPEHKRLPFSLLDRIHLTDIDRMSPPATREKTRH